ncbi:hypothetical protein PTKIN_Ptkin14bG0209200 [Pterospermum kingtungense]
MARKRSKNPTEDRPPASSSSSSSSSASSSSEEEEEEIQTPKTQKNPTLNVKPIATKPMEQTSKSKKPRSKPLASPVKASSSLAKRPSESQQEPKEVKRPKKKAAEDGFGSGSVAVVVEDVKKTGEDSKKQLFQRLFTEDDEIAVLKGMLDYIEKKGDPFADTNAFHDFVKKSIHTDVSKVQLMYKIRRLRKKFLNNVGKGKNGEDKVFSKPHEQKVFELSKKIWGKEGISGKVESLAAKSDGKMKGNSKPSEGLKAELVSSPHKNVDAVDGGEPMEVEKKGSKSLGGFFDNRCGVGGLEEEVLKHGLDMVGGEKREALEEKWRKLQVAELELLLKRNEFMTEQAKLVLEFYKSQDA